MARGQQWLNGTNGKAYIDSKKVMTQISCEFKVTGNFNEVITCGEYGTSQDYGGYSVEGSLKKYKVDSEFSKNILTGFLNGKPEYFDILIEIENKYTNKKEIWGLYDCVFTELGVTLEAGSTIEEELPFKCERVEILEEMS